VKLLNAMSKMTKPFRRPQAAELSRRLAGPRRFVQVVAGPRAGRSLVAIEVKSGRAPQAPPSTRQVVEALVL
jgi:hypothetical protein